MSLKIRNRLSKRKDDFLSSRQKIIRQVAARLLRRGGIAQRRVGVARLRRHAKEAGVGAVIASVVWDMGADIARQKSVSSMLIMAAAFVLSCVCKVNVVYIVLGCIALGTARTLLGRRKAG